MTAHAVLPSAWAHTDVLLMLVVAAAGSRLALATDQVLDVHAMVQPTALPGAPDVVLGVVDWRGDVVPLLDLPARLGRPTRQVAPSQTMVLTATAAGRRALLVDEALDLVEVAVAQVAGALAQGSLGAGAVRLPDGLVVVLDLDAVLTSEDEDDLRHALAAATSRPA